MSQFPFHFALACVAGLRKKGLKLKSIKMSAGGRRYGLQGRYSFVCFFRPPDEHENPDWSDLIDYLIHPCDWSATYHLRVIQEHEGRLAFLFNSRRINQWTISNYFWRNATIFRIKFVLKAKQKRAIENFFKTKLKIQGRINKLQALKETPLLVYCFLKKLFCLKVFFLI